MARYRDTAGYQGYGEIQAQDTGEIQAGDPKNTRQGIALYTILPLPMLYGAWHTRGGSRGNQTLRDIVCGPNTGG